LSNAGRQRSTATPPPREHTLLERGAAGLKRVLNQLLTVVDLEFGGAADLDPRDSSGQLGQTLFELLAVIVGRG
jgi:hypothetical protein